MLTSNQQRYVHSLLSHIEHEIQTGMADLEGADPDALFPRYVNYPGAKRLDALRAHLARLRSIMRGFMDAQGMANAELSNVDAAWGFQTRMGMAGNAVAELQPRYVRGYGELDAQGEQDCRALSAELGLLLKDIAIELRQQPLVLPSTHSKDGLLPTLVEVIERHQLLEMRSRAQALLTSDATQGIEVAILGRVSSGKSSLVNALLEQPLLPVGAIPVTAVVTRICYGDSLLIKAIDVDGASYDVAAEDLPDYIAESGNANNHRRLREVRIDVPVEIVRSGAVLVDTPGLGSLHAQASAHALNYLPRCDLGIITIDAAATLSPQDVDLARALQQAHAARLVVLTKVDSVSADALQQQRTYVEHALSQALGETIDVAAVSVDPAQTSTLQHWREDAFKPALASCAADNQARKQRRLADLARRVCVVLEQALEGAESSAPAAAPSNASGRALAELADAENTMRSLISDLGQRGAAVVLDDALPAIVADPSDVTVPLQARACELADEVVRDMLDGLTQAAADMDTQAVTRLLRGAPPFALSLSGTPECYPVRGPALWRRHRLRHLLHEDFEPILHTAFLAYGQELKRWLTHVGQALRRVLGSDTLTTHSVHGDAAAIRADLDKISALLGDDRPQS